jgi:hypothetical protein
MYEPYDLMNITSTEMFDVTGCRPLALAHLSVLSDICVIAYRSALQLLEHELSMEGASAFLEYEMPTDGAKRPSKTDDCSGMSVLCGGPRRVAAVYPGRLHLIVKTRWDRERA